MSEFVVEVVMTGSQAANTAELDLMRRLAAGQSGAMEELLRLHGRQLSRLVGRLTAWRSDHDDVLQEVLLRVWQQAGRFHGQGSLEGWLRRVAVNTCRNQQRSQNAITRLLSRFAGSVSTAKFEVSDTQPLDEREYLRTALADLPVADRTLLVLYYLEEVPADTVAELLGVQTKTLHVRLHRARKRLQRLLTDPAAGADSEN